MDQRSPILTIRICQFWQFASPSTFSNFMRRQRVKFPDCALAATFNLRRRAPGRLRD